MIPKPQWEKDGEVLAVLRDQINGSGKGRHARYCKHDGLIVTMWGGDSIKVSASDCTPHVAANFLELVEMGNVNVLKLILETCTLFHAITPTKGSKPLITFI